MRCWVRLFVAALIALTACACTSSGGGGGGEKSGHEWFQARPLIMPGQRATAVRADPFGSLHVPTTEFGYDRLRPAQQAALAAALRGVDCAHLPHLSTSADRVVCDAESDVFLLGAPLFTGNDVERAKSLAPSGGVTGWQVSLSLTSTAAGKMFRWTSRHHVLSQTGAFNDVQSSARPPCGLAMITQCSDFTAYVSQDLVVTVPVWFAPVQNTVVIAGQFSQAYAARLAHELAS